MEPSLWANRMLVTKDTLKGGIGQKKEERDVMVVPNKMVSRKDWSLVARMDCFRRKIVEIARTYM